MWLKSFFIFFLLAFFAVLQNSFFAHFNLFGAIPNFLFVLFFALVFFGKKNSYGELIFYSVSAGFFLDIYSNMFFGLSIISLLLVGCFVKIMQSFLHEKEDTGFPFEYFLPLFFVSLLAYDLILKSANFSFGFAAHIIYNLLVASAVFYFWKKFMPKEDESRQLPLFNKIK